VSFFWLKKLAGVLIMPLGLVSGLLVLGLILSLKRRRLGWILTAAGTGLLILLSLPATSAWLSHPLESRYQLLDPATLPGDLAAVVVLAAGINDQPNQPAFARLGQATLKRTLEGIRLWRARPEARLIMSSGTWLEGETPAAVLMAETAKIMGVNPDKITVEEVSRDTYENAVETKKILPAGPFVLVTSARHMVRAVAIFNKLGLSPIAAPTDFSPADGQTGFPWLPSLTGLANSEMSLYEYYGYVWYWLRGRL